MASNASDQHTDFHLRPLPKTPAQPAPAHPAPPQDLLPQNGQIASQSLAPRSPADFEFGTSSNSLVIAGCIFLALAIVFFFVRGGVRRHLIAGRASLSAASSAGWAVFAFLLTLSGAVVFGLFGSLWNLIAFTIPMGVLILATFVLSIVLYGSAARGRR